MYTYKDILIFFTIVVSTYSFPYAYPNENNPQINSNTQKANETHELTAEEVKKSYFEYYQNIKEHNYLDVSGITNPNTRPINVPGQQYPIDPQIRFSNLPQFRSDIFTPPQVQDVGEFIGLASNTKYIFEQPNRHLRSTHNKEEFNQNSLDTIANSNVRDNIPRERVKNIREHLKKYMEHSTKGDKNAPIRHNFEPYYPKQNNMVVLKVQEELSNKAHSGSGNMNKNDALKFLHIIEGNELLRNTEDTDYRFKIAFSDTFKH